MLTLFNVLKKTKIVRTYNDQGQSVSVQKKNVPSNKEWYNNVYAFDKNSLRSLPAIHDYVFKFLKGYFNIVSEKMEKDVFSRKYKKIRRTSGHKVWVSTPEIKHLSQEVNITVYVYNRVYNVYKNKLDFIPLLWSPKFRLGTTDEIKSLLYKDKKVSVKPTVIKKNFKVAISKTGSKHKTKLNNKYINRSTIVQPVAPLFARQFSTKSKVLESTNQGTQREVHNIENTFYFTRKVRLIRQEYPTYFGKKKNVSSLNYYVKVIKWLKLDKLTKIQDYKRTILNSIDINNANLSKTLNLIRLERYNYLINQFRKELVYLRFRQKLIFNKFKFSELYTAPIIDFLQSIYKKKVKLNVITLKSYYLNSSILLQLIETKLRKGKARGRHLRTIDRAMSRIRIPVLSGNKLQRIERKHIDMQNVILDNHTIISKQDSVEKFLLSKNVVSKKNIHKLVLKNLESKSISGLFIKISGRLTKRYKAQRALSTLRFRGTLKNVHSAHSGLSSSLSRGYSNINVEKAMIHSKNRIGAFGLTGWIASY